MRTMKALQLSLCAALLCAQLGTSAKADSWDKKTIVTLNDSVEIPGQILPPGTYVFKLLNSSSDRHIVQIWSGDETQVFATIQTIPIYRYEPPDKTVFEFDERPYDSPQALRAWFYPGDDCGNEFVYR
jgi:hypothetical protein